jgi:cytochrome b561
MPDVGPPVQWRARRRGHGAGYGVLLWLPLTAWIMWVVLGFGSDTYKPVNA